MGIHSVSLEISSFSFKVKHFSCSAMPSPFRSALPPFVWPVSLIFDETCKITCYTLYEQTGRVYRKFIGVFLTIGLAREFFMATWSGSSVNSFRDDDGRENDHRFHANDYAPNMGFLIIILVSIYNRTTTMIYTDNRQSIVMIMRQCYCYCYPYCVCQ